MILQIVSDFHRKQFATSLVDLWEILPVSYTVMLMAKPAY